MNFKRADFPDGFLFGAATAAYQIEGHKFGGAGSTHWDTFAATPGNVIRAEDGAVACDHYHRYASDLDLLKDAGMDAYRFSTSWARVMPDGRTINAQGLDFYDRLTDAILERGLKPFQTLYHWELPSALADQGGWMNRDTVMRFGDYVDAITDKIGSRMASIATINEPWCVAWLSHFMGHHAPGVRDIRAAARAMHHVLLAHGRATQVMRGLGMKNLGAVCNFEWSEPADNSPETIAAAARNDAIYNRFFLGGLFKGEYPDEVMEGFAPHLPTGWQDDFKTIQEPLDWLGLNYYTRKIVTHQDGAWPNYSDIEGPLPKTQMGWEIYPDGLRDFLLRTTRDYTGALPLYVTENGMANPDEPGQPDHARIDYLTAHLNAAREAIAQGVPLEGYFCWSLMDNYEWSLGYEKRFGLVHVDFDSLKRTPKASYDALAGWWRR